VTKKRKKGKGRTVCHSVFFSFSHRKYIENPKNAGERKGKGNRSALLPPGHGAETVQRDELRASREKRGKKRAMPSETLSKASVLGESDIKRRGEKGEKRGGGGERRLSFHSLLILNYEKRRQSIAHEERKGKKGKKERGENYGWVHPHPSIIQLQYGPLASGINCKIEERKKRKKEEGREMGKDTTTTYYS